MLHKIKLPPTRNSLTRKIRIGNNFEAYLTVVFYADDETQRLRPVEMFIKLAKAGSTLSGLAHALMVTASLALRYGVPYEQLIEHWQETKFEPCDDNYTSLVDAVSVTLEELTQFVNDSTPNNTTAH